jgi:chemotaxis protein MotA
MKRFDFAVLAGIVIGLLAVGLGAALEGIRPRFLWQPTAMLVVFGGTAGAVIVRRNLSGLLRAARSCALLLFKEKKDENLIQAARLTWLAHMARREGVRIFERHAANNSDRLVSTALLLAADRTNLEEVRAALDRILREEDEEGLRDAATLEAAASYGPTFGIIGAVLGLISVLRSLAEPAALGTGIATAFVATLYGIGLANLILFPLASRLRERHESQMRQREALTDALMALAANEVPSAIAMRFSAAASTNHSPARFQSHSAQS